MIINLLALAIFTPLLFWMISFIYTARRGSPYVPIKASRLKAITKFVKKGDRVAELGAGDGRVLTEAVGRGAAQATGWESDFAVYLLGRWRISRSNVDSSKVSLHFGDFWRAQLSDFNIIYLYQMTKYMHPFKTRLLPQLKPGTLIISPDYKIPGLRLHKKISDQDRGLYVYKV